MRSLGLSLVLLAALLPELPAQGSLPEGPVWGRPRATRPTHANAVFATGDGCAGCHSAAPEAVALHDSTGSDVSPHALWQGTLMANSFHDPYWRSQVAREIHAAPDQADEIQKLCVTCHAPTAHHSARLGGYEHGSVRDLASDPLARDGVTCTVCHQARPEGLGTPASFSGNLDIRLDRTIYGPYPEPFARPMQVHTAFTPVHGSHVSESRLCGSCHTLITRPAPDAPPFPEQTPYLEWRNSDFSDEEGRKEGSRTCQECHMADLGEIAIARNPGGGDFPIAPRKNYRAHAFVGGNALMLEILRDNAEELGVTAPKSSFDRMIRATRRQLTNDTARLEVRGLRREEGRMRFSIRVENLTGHKLPTGYPARRLVLQVSAAVGDRLVLETGSLDGVGALAGVEDEFALPHVTEVRDGTTPIVYEAVIVDLEDRPTTLLHAMARYRKDNRLLPRGWSPDGPDAEMTRPHGVEDDPDFAAGRDDVHFDLAVPEGADGELWVSATLLYQSIPPAWAAPHRQLEAEESRRFVRMYDAATTAAEVVARTTETR